MCVCFYRSKTYIFEEFLLTWQDRLRKLEQPTTMSVKLQAEVDKYKVQTQADLFFAVPKFCLVQLVLNSEKDLNEINYTSNLKAGSLGFKWRILIIR